jgi:hypothetical protein
MSTVSTNFLHKRKQLYETEKIANSHIIISTVCQQGGLSTIPPLLTNPQSISLESRPPQCQISPIKLFNIDFANAAVQDEHTEALIWYQLIATALPQLTVERIQPMTVRECCTMILNYMTISEDIDDLAQVFRQERYNYRNIGRKAYNINIEQASVVAMKWFTEYLHSISPHSPQ